MDNINPIFSLKVSQISSIEWGSAKVWNEGCDLLLKEYYSRILTWWPKERVRLPPNDRVILTQLSEYNDLEDQKLVQNTLNLVLSTSRAEGKRVEPATVDLLRIILNMALAVDNNAIDDDLDPMEPLLELFKRGYQIGYTDAGIEIHYQEGWKTFPVPFRSDVELYYADYNRC